VLLIILSHDKIFTNKVRTDHGTDSRLHLVHSRSNRYQCIFVDRHWSNSTCNYTVCRKTTLTQHTITSMHIKQFL